MPVVSIQTARPQFRTRARHASRALLITVSMTAAGCGSTGSEPDQAPVAGSTSASITQPVVSDDPTAELPDADPVPSASSEVERMEFSSPSSNIICEMRTEGVSCWISEKDWEIEQPVGCEDFDYGNAIDLFDTGVVWSCYSDFGWNLDADPLEYGSAAVIGQFRCESETTGVTCANAAGNGFSLARAAAEVF